MKTFGKRAVALIAMLLIIFSFAFPQKRTITGTITDNDGNYLEGVKISVQGMRKGTFTGADGTFSIAVSESDSILIIALAGYITEEVKINFQSIINVVLSREEDAIEELLTNLEKKHSCDITGTRQQ
jgi:hypothetical protein